MSSTVLADRYRVERPLGRGGMARVDLAHDVELDRRVAVKVLAEQLADDDELRARFVREGRFAARLGHPNVVGVLDAGETDGLPYIVMEYVDGRDAGGGRAPRGRAALGAGRRARGPGARRARARARGGPRPPRREAGQPPAPPRRPAKIGDFGIARAVELSGLTLDGTILGTAAYLAPEQARGEKVGPAADVYGLCAVLYELLTGRPPREVSSLADLDGALRTPIVPVRVVAPDVPSGSRRP